MADRVESFVRDKVVFLATMPGAGHWRRDLTSADVRFFPVYSYLIVYRPEMKPLQVVAILQRRCRPLARQTAPLAVPIDYRRI